MSFLKRYIYNAMKKLDVISDPKVEAVFKNYPEALRKQLLALRELIMETAEEIDEITKVEETLKWGEPSYLTRIGSTLRMDWKPKTPTQYYLYFKCTSKLVTTFKEVFAENLNYDGNRAIILKVNESIPKKELKHCIKAALTYHKVKHLPYLGIVI